VPVLRRLSACVGRYVAVSSCVALMGCAATRSTVSTMSVDWLVQQNVAGCNAQALQPLRGAHFTVLADVPMRGELRVLRPGQDLTSDVNTRRLNVQVDANGQMLRLFCG
jgi:hypothetical protein